MIKNEFECSTLHQAKLLNAFSTVKDTQVIFKFTDSNFQTFHPHELRPPIQYKFEGDTLVINYLDETPPFVSKSFIEFSSDTLIMRELRKETNCILVASFKRIE